MERVGSRTLKRVRVLGFSAPAPTPAHPQVALFIMCWLLPVVFSLKSDSRKAETAFALLIWVPKVKTGGVRSNIWKL